MKLKYNLKPFNPIRSEKLVENGLDNGFARSQSELVAMMNDHNLNDSLDNEVPPEFEEPDEPFVSGKLANLGGKLPSEITPAKRAVAYAAAETTKPSATKPASTKKEVKVSSMECLCVPNFFF